MATLLGAFGLFGPRKLERLSTRLHRVGRSRLLFYRDFRAVRWIPSDWKIAPAWQ